MGYETELIFIKERKNSSDGYRTILARLEMGCICSDNIGKLIEIIRKKNKSKLVKKKAKKLFDELLEVNNQIQSDVDEFVFGDERYDGLKGLEDKRNKIEKKLSNMGFVYVYCEDGDSQVFDDKYGDPLLITELEELEKAIRLDNARMINGGDYNEKGYRRFDLSLRMIEGFKDKELWPKDIKVILYGH